MGVRIKTADKRWNSLHHAYELTLTPASVVRLVDDPQVDASIPEAHFDFVPLREVSKKTSESFIGQLELPLFPLTVSLEDVIGIVESCTAVIPFVSRTSNRDSKRRELTLVDEETSISITLWDEQVNQREIYSSRPSSVPGGEFRRRTGREQSCRRLSTHSCRYLQQQ